MTGTYDIVPVTCALPAHNFFLFNFCLNFVLLIFFCLNLFIIRPVLSDQTDSIRDCKKMAKGN